MADMVYELGGRTLTFTGKDAEARHLAYTKVAEFLDTKPVLAVDPEATHQRIIWSYWEQGWDQAPTIVKSCGARMLKESGDFEVRLLDESSLASFVQIDPVVAERTWQWKAHYSDILRAYILAEHGGIWIDATVLVTQRLDSLYRQFEHTPFFAYTVTKFLSSWFLAARRQSIVPVALRDFFVWFWNNHDELPHYFWLHLCFEALYDHIPAYMTAWDQTIIQSSPDAHALQKAQLSPLDRAHYQRILRTTHVQKMTYRFNGAPAAPAGSYLEQVFKDFPPDIPPSDALATTPPSPARRRLLPAWKR